MTMLDAKTIAMLQMEANQSAARRSGKSGARLLDDAENNVGNSVILQPQNLPPPSYTAQPDKNPPRILNLTANTNTGQNVTVVMTAAIQAGGVSVAGPITGIIDFGNGTQFTSVFFDIPIGPYVGSVNGGSIPNDQPQDSGAVIQVPSSIVRAYARYDNEFLTPEVDGFVFGSPRSANPLPAISGPFPVGVPAASPILVKAFANYFGRIHSKLYKTQYLYKGNFAAPISFFDNPITQAPTAYFAPPFAKTVRLLRAPFSAAMTLVVGDQLGYNSTYNIASNTNSPVIEIDGNAHVIFVSSATVNPADEVCAVSLVYEIGF